jgi:hypothetical protein
MKNTIVLLVCLLFLACSSGEKQKTEVAVNEPAKDKFEEAPLVMQRQELVKIKKREFIPVIPDVPKRIIPWNDFNIMQEGQAVVKAFNEDHWDEIMRNNYVDVSRYGSHPMNLASGNWHTYAPGGVVYDNDYYYALGMSYGSNHVHKIHKHTGKETILKLPVEGPVRFLNLWENYLYFINKNSINRYNLGTSKLEAVKADASGLFQISIVDNRLFYSSVSGGIWVHDLESKEHRQIVDGPVRWFWITEDLLLYTDNNDAGFVVDMKDKKRYSTDVTFLRGSYIQDRLLFSPLPEIWFDYLDFDDVEQARKLEEANDIDRKPFIIYFGQDSLVVLPHRESFMGLLLGKFLGLPRNKFDYDDTRISEYIPRFGDNLKGYSHSEVLRDTPGELVNSSVSMFYSGDQPVSYEYYAYFPVVFIDLVTGETLMVDNEDDFIKNNPRALPPEFEVWGDTLVIANASQGSVRIELEGERSYRKYIKVTGQGYDRKIWHWLNPFSLKGFYQNKVLLTNQPTFDIPYGSIYLYCIDTDEDILYKGGIIELFRDGFLYIAYVNDSRIASFDLPE